MEKLSIAAALRKQMLEEGAKRAWSGHPDLLLTAYMATGGRAQHPLDSIKAVLNAARNSDLFVQKGYIRACDSAGRGEILHPVFDLSEHQPKKTAEPALKP